MSRRRSKRALRPLSLTEVSGIFNDAPVIYEATRFQRAGFHDHRHNSLTPYEGPPNEQNEAAWARLLRVGVIAINEQENSRLINGTAPTMQDPKSHIVELEMFHQLHCLVSPRTLSTLVLDCFETSG